MVTVGVSAARTQTAVTSRTTRIAFGATAVNFILILSCSDVGLGISVPLAGHRPRIKRKNPDGSTAGYNMAERQDIVRKIGDSLSLTQMRAMWIDNATMLTRQVPYALNPQID